MSWNGIIDTYKNFLPVNNNTPIISLKEGNTPLLKAEKISNEINPKLTIYLKYEGLNPTGSFKDRGMTMAISKAMEQGSKAVMCASTGNTSASASAYSAKCGLDCYVIIPEGSIAMGKLAQAMIYNATVIAIKGNFDDALKCVCEITDKYPITLVNSLNPFRIEGQKTGSFEICDVLGKAPCYHAIPVGNAGNITAYWKGYKEYKDAGKIDALPKMIGFQAAGSAPIVLGHPVEDPQTIATAIKIGNPASWEQAVTAKDESGGLIDMVTDEEILEAYKMLANMEGVFVEPASAASLAGVIKKNNEGYFGNEKADIVCVLTGNGLKDPDRAIAVAEQPTVVENSIDEIIRVCRQNRGNIKKDPF